MKNLKKTFEIQYIEKARVQNEFLRRSINSINKFKQESHKLLMIFEHFLKYILMKINVFK